MTQKQTDMAMISSTPGSVSTWTTAVSVMKKKYFELTDNGYSFPLQGHGTSKIVEEMVYNKMSYKVCKM